MEGAPAMHYREVRKKAQLSLWSHLPGFVSQITVDPREFKHGDETVGEE